MMNSVDQTEGYTYSKVFVLALGRPHDDNIPHANLATDVRPPLQ